MALWESLQSEENDIQPTPPVGWDVQFLPNGRVDAPVAAKVVAVEAFARVTLQIFEANRHPATKKGVYYHAHPLVRKHNSPQAHNNGTWRYIPDTPIPSSHNKLHKDSIETKKATAAKAEADKKRREAEEAEAAKPRRQRETVTA